MTIAATHTVVKSKPIAHRFGAGILPFVPFAVVPSGYFEPSDQDRADAAQMFGDEDPDWDARAAEDAGYDAVTAGCYA